MKILIAADGPTLESRVAKRFGHAPYYLQADTETLELTPAENEGHDEKHGIIATMAGDGATAAIVGNIGPVAFNQLTAKKMRVALARNMTVSEAIDRFKSGRLRVLDEPTVKESIRDQRHEGGRRGGGFRERLRGKGNMSGRGHHHLQQFGGRAH